MQCERARVVMLDVVDGADCRELAEHTAVCLACCAEWRRLRAIDELLRRQSLVDPPSGFVTGVLSRLEAFSARREGWQVGLATAVSVALGGMVAAIATVAWLSNGLWLLDKAGSGVVLAGAVGSFPLALGPVYDGLARGMATGAGSCVLAVVIALAWFGALILPRQLAAARQGDCRDADQPSRGMD